MLKYFPTLNDLIAGWLGERTLTTTSLVITSRDNPALSRARHVTTVTGHVLLTLSRLLILIYHLPTWRPSHVTKHGMSKFLTSTMVIKLRVGSLAGDGTRVIGVTKVGSGVLEAAIYWTPGWLSVRSLRVQIVIPINRAVWGWRFTRLPEKHIINFIIIYCWFQWYRLVWSQGCRNSGDIGIYPPNNSEICKFQVKNNL